MQHGRVLNLRGYKNIITFLQSNYWLLISAVFFIVGLSIGVFTFGKYNLVIEWSKDYLIDFINFRNSNGFFKVLIDSFLSSMFFLVLVFICGTSIFGIGLVPVCVAFRGFLYGSVTAMLYSVYSLKGIAFHAVLLMPSAVFFIIAFIMASVESVRFSLVYSRLTLPNSMPVNLSMDFKRYCYRYILFCILILLSAAADAFISCNFLSKFSL